MRLQVVEEILPLLAKPMGDVIPEPLDSRVVYTATPNVRASVETPALLHPGRDFEVFGAMVTADTARDAVHAGGLSKEPQDA